MAGRAETTAPPDPAALAQLRRRKAEHVELALHDAVAPTAGPGWHDVHLIHEALPEVDADEIDLTTALLGRTLALPLVIAGMTGGYDGALAINGALARAAARHGVGIGLGSQRAALLDPTLEPTYAVVREQAPDALVIGNIGAAQLIRQGDRAPLAAAQLRRAVEMIDADALAIHLNVLEEAVQPEGDRRTRGIVHAIGELVATLGVPVIVKETGAGIARGTAERLRALGVAALDVGGLGGTSFARIERLRAERQGDPRGSGVGADIAEWGIPTAVSIVGARAAGMPLIATGGVRTGLDAAKAIALGATAVGVARPLLLAAREGDAALDAWIERFRATLATVHQLTGCRTPGQLRGRPVVVTGATRGWLDDLAWARTPDGR